MILSPWLKSEHTATVYLHVCNTCTVCVCVYVFHCWSVSMLITCRYIPQICRCDEVAMVACVPYVNSEWLNNSSTTAFDDLAKMPTAHHQLEAHIPSTYTVYNMQFSWPSAFLACCKVIENCCTCTWGIVHVIHTDELYRTLHTLPNTLTITDYTSVLVYRFICTQLLQGDHNQLLLLFLMSYFVFLH